MTPACKKKMAYIPAMNGQVTNEMPAHHFTALQNADFSQFRQSSTKMPSSGRENHTDLHLGKKMNLVYTFLYSL